MRVMFWLCMHNTCNIQRILYRHTRLLSGFVCFLSVSLSHSLLTTHTHTHTFYLLCTRCGDVFNTTTRPPVNYHKFSTFSFSFPFLGFVFLCFSDFVSATFICGCWWRGGLVWDLPRLTVSTQQVLRFTQDTCACDSCLSYLRPSISQRGQRRKWMDEWLMNLFRDKSA